MKRTQIIDTAIQQFELLTSWKIKIEELIHSIESIDGNIVLLNSKTKKKLTFKVEIKNEIGNNNVLQLMKLKDKYADLFILAQYISKPNREQLRKFSINYLESSGNCYIEKDGVFIFIDNQKVLTQRQTNSSKLYTESGMRFIYAGLLNPDFTNGTYREIAYRAQIALGNVGAVIEALEEENFIQEKNGVRSFKNKDALFDVWANNFDTTMRPHLLQTRLSFADKKNVLNWKSIELESAFWGGEPAAALLDKYLMPEQFIIYSKESLSQIMKRYRLIPDIGGNVLYMLPPFEYHEIPKQADPFIIYAELIQSKDSRCLEAAQRIKEKYIDPKL